MASFEQHVNIAVIATGVLIAPLFSSGLIDTNQALILLSLGLLGGVLPDLDSDNSKPVQIFFKIISIFFPLLLILSLSDNLPILHLIGIWLLSSAILHLLFSQLFLKLTVHRGIFHSIPMGILFAQLTILIFLHLLTFDLTFSTISGIFLFFGFFIHLLLDELISLNMIGLKMKKSLGTAMKFYDKNNKVGTLILYGFIIILFTSIPLEKDVYLDVFEALISMKFI